MSKKSPTKCSCAYHAVLQGPMWYGRPEAQCDVITHRSNLCKQMTQRRKRIGRNWKRMRSQEEQNSEIRMSTMFFNIRKYGEYRGSSEAKPLNWR